MFDVGFSEILLTSAIALVVLGPERLPKVARQVGNWMGRARAMARQLSEQLEREVNAEEVLRQQKKLAESFRIDANSPAAPQRRVGPVVGAPPPEASPSIPPPAQQAVRELHESHETQYQPDPPMRDTSPQAMHANDPKPEGSVPHLRKRFRRRVRRARRGTLISHLLELRDRLLKAMLAVGIAFVPCAMYMNQLFSFVAKPLIAKLPAGATIIATSVVAPFTVPFKLALVLAIGVAMPFVLFQAWAFVAPGLYKHEKKLAVPLLISSVLLFYLGAAFAYYAVFPVMLSFFVATTPNGVQMMTDMNSYLDFVMVLLLAFGAAFEVPVATVLIVWTGFVKLETLRKNRGFVILGLFIFAAFVTPPDAVSQSAMALPMCGLYEIGLVMAGILLKDKLAARAKEEAEQAQNGI